jgi:hypothetical protein
LWLCAKHLFIAARVGISRNVLDNPLKFRRCQVTVQPWTAQRLQPSLMGHLNRSIDGVFEIVRVVGRSFVSIAEVHAIFARAQQAQREPEVARNRFRFLERHGLVK